MRLNTHTRETTREEFEIARRHASGERKIFWISSRSSPSVGWQPSRSLLRTSRRASREMICVTAPVAARVLAKSGARRAPARSAPRRTRVSPRVLHRVPRCHPARLRQRGLLVRGDRGDQGSPASAPSPRPRPPRASPDRANPHQPRVPRRGRLLSAALLIAVIARGVAGGRHRLRGHRLGGSAVRRRLGRRRLPRGRLRLGLAQRRVMGGRAPCDDHRRPDVVLRLGVRHPAQERGGLRRWSSRPRWTRRWRSRADWGSSARVQSARRGDQTRRREVNAKRKSVA